MLRLYDALFPCLSTLYAFKSFLVYSGDDASDLEGVSFTHEAISTSAVMPLAGMREEVSHCVSSDLKPGGA